MAPPANAAPSPAAQPAAVGSDAVPTPASATSNGEATAIVEVEQAKQITKDAFNAGMKKLLILAIDGYPKALRSTLARRNAELRQTNGDQDAACEVVKARAAAMSEEGKTWLLGLVPFIGFPAQLLYPTWMIMRRVCLLAAIYGLDLSSEDTRGRILHVFAGLRAVPAVECGMEMAVQAVWVALVGPVAGIVPVGTLVTKVTNVEGHVVDAMGRETFSEMQRKVPEAEYAAELDPEPTLNDYLDLAKQGTAFALYSAMKAPGKVVSTMADKDKRTEAMGQATDVARQSVDTGIKVGTAAANVGMAVGAGAVALVQSRGSQLATAVTSQAKEAAGAVTGQREAADKTVPGQSQS